MSIAVMSAVWAHARCSGGTLLVLLAMADYAHDDGTGVYPKQATLASKARMGERNLRTCLDALEAEGYIERIGKRGQIIEWRVETDPAKIAARNPIAGSSGTEAPTEPSIEPSKGEANASPSKKELVDPALKYRKAETPGSAAAPWMVIELARLMHERDPACKLPVGLRELMAPEYLPHFASGGARSSVEARRETLLAVDVRAGLLVWLDDMRLLIDSDQRDPREVVQVLRWCQADSFWHTNIRSAGKFRKQYDQLRAKWLQEGGGSSGQTSTTRPPDRGPSSAAQLDAVARRAQRLDGSTEFRVPTDRGQAA